MLLNYSLFSENLQEFYDKEALTGTTEQVRKQETCFYLEDCLWRLCIYTQAPGTRGSRGGPCPPLELRFYRVKIFKMGKISFFYYSGPPYIKIVPRALSILYSIYA